MNCAATVNGDNSALQKLPVGQVGFLGFHLHRSRGRLLCARNQASAFLFSLPLLHANNHGNHGSSDAGFSSKTTVPDLGVLRRAPKGEDGDRALFLRTMHDSLRRSSLDSVDGCTHNPMVARSRPRLVARRIDRLGRLS